MANSVLTLYAVAIGAQHKESKEVTVISKTYHLHDGVLSEEQALGRLLVQHKDELANCIILDYMVKSVALTLNVVNSGQQAVPDHILGNHMWRYNEERNGQSAPVQKDTLYDKVFKAACVYATHNHQLPTVEEILKLGLSDERHTPEIKNYFGKWQKFFGVTC